MNTTANKKNFYEEVIELLCQKAKDYPAYKEGDRASDGCPMGMTPFAIMAKVLWMFQRDGLQPINIAEGEIPQFEEVINSFKALYVLKDPSKKSGDFMSDYVLA